MREQHTPKNSSLGFHKRNFGQVYRGVRPWLHPWRNCWIGEAFFLRSSNVVVITSALHAVGRRFEPGIQYDSLFFVPRGAVSPRRRRLIFTRASRGQREACVDSGLKNPETQ